MAELPLTSRGRVLAEPGTSEEDAAIQADFAAIAGMAVQTMAETLKELPGLAGHRQREFNG